MTRLVTVSSIFEAYLHFQPYNPDRDSETVTIHNTAGTELLSWCKGSRIFTRDDGKGNKAAFQGYLIDTMGIRSRAFLAAAVTEGATIQ